MNVKRNLLLAAAFLASTQMASALTIAELTSQYQADGYSYIEAREGVSQYKIEAIRDGVKVEVIYDAVTGQILETSSYNVGTIGSSDPGVQVRKVNRDFVDGDDDSNDDDGIDDDSNDDNDDNGRDDDKEDNDDKDDNDDNDSDSNDD